MDFFCPNHYGIRVGYASPKLVRALPRAQRRRLQGKAVLVLTASSRYALRRVRVGTHVAKVARRLRLGRPFAIGRNRWYVVADGSGRGVMKVRHGVIDEVGIANPGLTRTRAGARRFLSSFS